MKITRDDRSPYWDLMRWYRVRKDGKLFINRFRVIQTPLFAVYLSRIHGPDTDRDPHDHSRPFITVILSGAYTEELFEDGRAAGFRHHPRFSVKYIPVRYAHQITEIEGPLRTLLIAGWRLHGGFRFWTPSGPVPAEDYNT